MGDPAESVVNDQGVDTAIMETPSSQGTKVDTESGLRVAQTGDDSEHDRNESRHRKKKRHRHRIRSNTEDASEFRHGATSGGHDGDNETGEESSGNNENVVVSSSIRKKRSKGSSRHHKHSSADAVSGEDSGLSLGNSLNESTVAGDLSRVTPNENEIESRFEVTTGTVESQNYHLTQDIGNVLDGESHSAKVKKVADDEDKKEQAASLTNSNDNDQSNNTVNGSTTKESHFRQRPVSNSKEQQDARESKKTDRMHRRLERQKTQYRLEKEMLKKRLDETKTKFQEEITKYEQDLSDHRKEYLKELSSLQLQEQYESLSVRISDLDQLEDDLDKRFNDCMEQQTDIEEMERFLSMREELCKSKERDITKLDDELDAWQNELDIKRHQLETADTSRRRGNSSLNTSYSKPTTDEEDYILKKNLLKCQADLSRSEEENATLHKQLDSLKKQFDSAQIQTHNHEKKIKQLENQLVIALSQLGSQKQNHLNQNSLPPINGQRPSIASSSADSRIDEIQREMRSRRQLGKDQLSINQEAALRRKLSGKDSGVSTRSPSSSRISTRTPGSIKEHSLNKETGGRSNALGSAGGSQSGEEGCQHQGSATSADVGTSPGKASTSASPKTERSSVCAVM